MKNNIVRLIILFLLLSFYTVDAVERYKYSIEGGVNEVKSEYKQIPKPDIKIEAEKIELESDLKEYYEAYSYKIINNSKDELFLVNGRFEGGLDGGDAYFLVRKNADEEFVKTVWKHSDLGPATLGIAWGYDFLKAPFVWFSHIRRNKEMKSESLLFCKEEFFQAAFDPQDVIEKNVLFPMDAAPYVRITFRDNETGNFFTYTRDGFDEKSESQNTKTKLLNFVKKVFPL